MRALKAARGHGLGALMLAVVVLLSACQSVPRGFPLMARGSGTAAVTPTADAPLPPAKGEVIGAGTVRMALLLPLTAPGNGGKVAGEFRNAAILAMEDFGQDAVQLVVKDTAGQPGPATDAAAEALSERAAIVLGPMFSGNVSVTSGVLSPSGKVMIAFSSDRRTARPGVYLMSFLPGAVVERTLNWAIARDHRSVAAILPQGAYGDVVEAQARRTLDRAGGRLTGVARYAYDAVSVDEAARTIATAAAEADAILIPDGGTSPGAIVNALRRNGVNLTGKRLLGSGQWGSANLSNPALAGAWFADVDRKRIGEFQRRYGERFGAEPTVNAVLAYDAVALVAGLAKARGAPGLTAASIEAPTGYNGYGGIFRFSANGLPERGFAVYEVRDGRPEPVSAAPGSFGPES